MTDAGAVATIVNGYSTTNPPTDLQVHQASHLVFRRA